LPCKDKLFKQIFNMWPKSSVIQDYSYMPENFKVQKLILEVQTCQTRPLLTVHTVSHSLGFLKAKSSYFCDHLYLLSISLTDTELNRLKISMIIWNKQCGASKVSKKQLIHSIKSLYIFPYFFYKLDYLLPCFNLQLFLWFR
jgi:hypothetical protein